MSQELPRCILHVKSPMVRSGAVEKIILSIMRKSPRVDWAHHVALLQPVGSSQPAPGGHDDILTESSVGTDRLHYIQWQRRTLLIDGLINLLRIAQRENVRLIHCHDNRSNFLGFIVGKWLGIPLVTSIHGWVPISRKLRFLVSIDKVLIRYFDRIIAGSPSLERTLVGVYGNKVTTVMYGIDLENLPCAEDLAGVRERFRIGEGDVVIATVLRLSPEKGHKYLLEALPTVLKQFPRVKVLIVGEGPLRRDLEAYSQALGIHGRVIFTGFYPNVGDVFSLADIVVQPSLAETLSISLLESMAYGKAVVATDVGGAAFAVANNVSGLLVPPGRSDALAEALRQLLEGPAERQGMGEKARGVIAEQFSDVRMVQRLLEVYTQYTDALKEGRGVEGGRG